MHQFGYNFAKKVLGEKQVNQCIRQAYESELQNPLENQLHFFRGNWRSNVRYPWDLPTLNSALGNAMGIYSMAGGVGDDEINPQTLFVDITFDFILFPTEIVTEGRTYCCHVLKKEEFWGEDVKTFQGGSMSDEANSIALSVAIRIGALVAIPSSQCSDDNNDADNSSSSDDKKSLADIDNDNINVGDGYQYYYKRGENALTVSDLDEHCNGIEISRESMDSADVARIIGDEFLQGCSGRTQWQVIAKREKDMPNNATGSINNLTTIDGKMGMTNEKSKKQLLTCHLKLHDKSMGTDGMLPLSSNGTGGCDSSSQAIDRSILDMILLQSNTSSPTIVQVPKTEALSLWRAINPAFVSALEKPIEPSPQKMSPAREVAAAAEECDGEVTNPYAKKMSPKVEAKSEEEPRRIIRKPPRPAEQHLFAKGKKTTLGGGRKKKPKFRMGAA